MFSMISNQNRSLKKCMIVSGILSSVTVVLLLYSGSSSSEPLTTSSSVVQIANHSTGDKDGPQAHGSGAATKLSRPLTTHDIIERRFQERQKLINQTCQREDYKELKRTVKNRRFFPIARGRLRWCRIPKVGTTYLSGLERRYFRGALTKIDGFPQRKTAMFVREPYSRLVSGYIGKIVTNQPWWKSYGTSIVKKFRPRATDKAKQCGNDVTFPEFLKYFISTQVEHFKPNMHWSPLHKQCNPCGIHYDFVGHLETFKDDLSHALKSVGVSVDMDFSDEEDTMRLKASAIIKQKKQIEKCESMCSALRTVWWSFHARGLISTDIKFPLQQDQCNVINGTEFTALAWDAHIQSMGTIDKHKQRRDILVKLYLQAPLEDRMKVRELLMKDFELYGYDSLPADLFPELSNSLG